MCSFVRDFDGIIRFLIFAQICFPLNDGNCMEMQKVHSFVKHTICEIVKNIVACKLPSRYWSCLKFSQTVFGTFWYLYWSPNFWLIAAQAANIRYIMYPLFRVNSSIILKKCYLNRIQKVIKLTITGRIVSRNIQKKFIILQTYNFMIHCKCCNELLIKQHALLTYKKEILALFKT